MTTLQELQEYWDQLNQFDWYYSWSDDGGVWRRGTEREAKLIGISRKSPEHKALYEGFRLHHFTGPSWPVKEKAPKPERPA